MAKMRIDFTESQRQVCPEGEYSLRAEKKEVKNSSAGKPMIEITWIPFNPPDGVSMDQIEKAKPKDWISLAPNALFSLASLMNAAGVPKECSSCQNQYSAKLDVCDRCSSAVFDVDSDFIDTCEVRAFLKVKKDQKNENDVNEIRYIAAA